VGIGKDCPALCQSIHVRSLNLRVPAQWTHPVVQIIDRDKKNVGLGSLCYQTRAEEPAGH